MAVWKRSRGANGAILTSFPILHFGQIHFAIWTNTFHTLEKYISEFGQIHSTFWANKFRILDKYISQFTNCAMFQVYRNAYSVLFNICILYSGFGYLQIYLTIWTNTFSILKREKNCNSDQYILQFDNGVADTFQSWSTTKCFYSIFTRLNIVQWTTCFIDSRQYWESVNFIYMSIVNIFTIDQFL